MTSFCRREMMLWYWETWYSTLFVFFVTLVLMFLALFAYFSVLRVSSKVDYPPAIFAIITVRQLPPRLSFRSLVSLLSRYGM